MKILVVEDNMVEQEGAVQQLSENGHDVVLAKTFREAEEQIKKGGYEVLLTDIFFPFGLIKGYKIPLRTFEECEKPEPLGYPLMLFALQHGVTKIGAISDANHHDGPMAAMTDSLIHKNGGDKIFSNIFIFVNDAGFRTETGNKNWFAVLKAILEDKDIEEDPMASRLI